MEETEEAAPKASRKKAEKEPKQQELFQVEGTSPARKRLTSGKEASKDAKQNAIVNGQQGVMTNLKEIHKTLGTQNPSTDAVIDIEPNASETEEIASNVIDFRTRFEQMSMESDAEPAQRSFITIEQEPAKRWKAVVEKIINQMIHVVNGVIEAYGKPDEIRIELARELKKNAENSNILQGNCIILKILGKYFHGKYFVAINKLKNLFVFILSTS